MSNLEIVMSNLEKMSKEEFEKWLVEDQDNILDQVKQDPQPPNREPPLIWDSVGNGEVYPTTYLLDNTIFPNEFIPDPRPNIPAEPLQQKKGISIEEESSAFATKPSRRTKTTLEKIKESQEKALISKIKISGLQKDYSFINNSLYNSTSNTFKTKPEKEEIINDKEELYINYNELADTLAINELTKVHGKYDEKSMIDEYVQLLEKYKNIILKHEKNSNK